MPQRSSPHARGFTLVEMLVVIAIIGVLAALLVPVAGNAIRRGREAAIGIELSNIAAALEAYKAKFGDYPPDFTPVPNNATRRSLWDDRVAAHLRAGFSRNTIDLGNWRSTAIGARDPENLDASEALVFWLAMLSTNSRNPFHDLENGSGERHQFFEFDETRLTGPLFPEAGASFTDLDQDGWPEYVSKYTPDTPYVYFDGRVTGGEYAYRYASYSSLSDAGVLRPFRTNTEKPQNDERTKPYDSTHNPTTWLGAGKFQLHSAGLDEHFGVDLAQQNSENVFKQFPDTNYDDEESGDNIADFSAGKTFEASVP